MLRGASLLSTTSRITARSTRSHLVKRTYTTNGEESTKKSGSVGKSLLWLTLIGTGTYAGATYLALNNEAFHDTYTTYIPGGERVLDFLEDTAANADFKEYYEKGVAWKHQASQTASTVSTHASNIKESVMDWYDYLSEAVAQIKGEKEPATLTSSDNRQRRSFNKTETPLFDNIVQGGGAARIPSFKITPGEPAVDDLVKTTQELIQVLNQVGLTGHAKRLADFTSRYIHLIDQEFKAVREGQELVLTKVAQLNKHADKVDNQVSEHYKELVAKVTDAQTKSKKRVTEKADKLKQLLVAENNKLQQQLVDMGQLELDSQREQAMSTLKQDLSDQMVSLQKNFAEQVQRQVEEERGGRLANVDSVVASQTELERLSSANAEYLDDSRKAHQLLVAIDALKRAAYCGNKQAFLQELQTLRVLSRPDSPFANQVEKRNDELVQVVAANISETVAEHGISSFIQLVERFDKVAKEVRDASLIPEEGSSMISHIISIALSKLLFPKKGLVPGDDIEARLARAEYYLTHGDDLESATREMNQLKGWPKHLTADWLDAARRHLEIKQALQVMRTQAILNSLLQLD
ncbi:mitochondrial inner membrane protein-domain-containing protein [Halteromyces radiatus]|uniref:mitochondrial inner membrane protein-domain-containing protein n=1 Tax=Halteromyces radiatus TaxID=101107 RepID=UPI00221EEE88|nr:mitochondrial inner membrane protein-domain-containing protein [Halteromyces radiatus]KAI8099928.1 mitochondrial inner membrane protein-domain-containing protein [Halteromyces radiatus]